MSKIELIKIASKIKEDELDELYEWINSFSFSRPIKNLHRDFSDGVLMAELIDKCLPKFVELHNYSKAHSTNQKKYNWNTMNEKVFKRLGFKIDKKHIEEVVNCKSMGVEKILYTFKQQLNKFEKNNKEEEEKINGTTEEKENEQKNELEKQKKNVTENEESDSLILDFDFTNNDEIIKILKDKIQNLEKLLKLKVLQ